MVVFVLSVCNKDDDDLIFLEFVNFMVMVENIFFVINYFSSGFIGFLVLGE